MEWLSHSALIISISIGIVSEGLAIIQQLKYPTNSGVGGILSTVLKFLNFLKNL